MSSRPSSFTLTRPGPLRLYSTTELLKLPPPEWQIWNTFPENALVGLYGPPGCGKSFVAIDMALSIATGRPWQGHVVKQGFGLYVSAEGGAGIGKRAAAWCLYQEVEPKLADVAWLIESVPVSSDSEDMDRLMGRIVDEVEREPTLIVIDTLARCFDGDENQQEDMGRFIGGCDRLRNEFNATVLVVHHTRLDGERERGNTAFRGACDTMIALERKPESGSIIMTCSKQKDSEEFDLMSFVLRPVPEHESCVLVGSKKEATQAALNALANESVAFTRLIKAIKDEAHCSSATAKRALVSLIEKGEIIKENGIYFKA